MNNPPNHPKTRYWCEACGTIENGRHTSVVCRVLLWIDKRTFWS